ncbi:unnamed protein product [Paramecium sonneborni]|uniref:Uncharacterized protein n=1 Tax=Paramecium sonneborni TaxID=65129 RepID=A0A8S1PFC2_9CILI|nr:unnamed protein product [Paramecium sonneborni]
MIGILLKEKISIRNQQQLLTSSIMNFLKQDCENSQSQQLNFQGKFTIKFKSYSCIIISDLKIPNEFHTMQIYEMIQNVLIIIKTSSKFSQIQIIQLKFVKQITEGVIIGVILIELNNLECLVLVKQVINQNRKHRKSKFNQKELILILRYCQFRIVWIDLMKILNHLQMKELERTIQIDQISGSVKTSRISSKVITDLENRSSKIF